MKPVALSDDDISAMKKYYENCMEPKPDIFALFATIEAKDRLIKVREDTARRILDTLKRCNEDLKKAENQIRLEQKINATLLENQRN